METHTNNPPKITLLERFYFSVDLRNLIGMTKLASRLSSQALQVNSEAMSEISTFLILTVEGISFNDEKRLQSYAPLLMYNCY